ncbi:hypothetical protein [Sphingomonas adhaesiva]|uniref:hypothetical protein n=1 Tax=Sphingomonas adhaesiva TaxID=28212 RepID=UPI002FFC70D5
MNDFQEQVSGNAILLLGAITAHVCAPVKDPSVLSYEVVSIDPTAGLLILANSGTGNTFRVSVTQVAGRL